LIKRLDMVRVLDGLLVKTPYRANRALATISKLFSWCVNRGSLEFFPLAGLEAPTNQSTRDRVLTDEELNAYRNGAAAEDFRFEHFAKLIILTGQRRVEVAAMRSSEIDFAKSHWTIPAKREEQISPRRAIGWFGSSRSSAN
jgi:integrase